MAEIHELPKRRTPKQLARAYMMGELDPADYPTQGGLRNWMLLADHAESEIARDAALRALEKLANLGHDFDGDMTVECKLIAIKNDGKGNIERIASA